MYEVCGSERAVVISLDFGNADDHEASVEELRQLISTAGAEILQEFTQRRIKPDLAYYLGQGKAEELSAEVKALGADVVIVNSDLTPVQLRNLESVVGVRVVDRTQLILDIFAQRAQTREGKLQVELAQLKYLLPRITSLYTEFERQQGGIGVRGPGETKLEADRRRILKRIKDLTEEIDKVRQHRHIQKQGRQRLPFPSAALVGYTSAGKSTLLNTLAGSNVLVDPKLFATLDPTTRRVVLSSRWSVLLTDTVGFIRGLPHDLIAAFRATLEEVTEADFLIHVVDSAHPRMREQITAVKDVIHDLGAGNKPTLTVFNKCDLVEDQYTLRQLVAETPDSVYISALKQEGIPQLMSAISRLVESLLVRVSLSLPYDRSDLVSLIYQNGRVMSIEHRSDRIVLEAEVSKEIAGRLAGFARDAAGPES